MNKKILITILLITVLFIVGCGLRNPDVNLPTVINYHKGTQGVEMEIVKGLPPDEIIESSDFIIGLEMRNLGAFDVEGARVIVYGFEEGYTFVEDDEQVFDIDGKKPGFPEGGYEIINFQAKNLGMPAVLKKYPISYRIRTFYNYETEAGIEVCINPNIYSYLKTKEVVCKPDEIRLSGGQGAPVAVTKVEQAYSPSDNKMKVNFIIHIANKGKGEVSGTIDVKQARLSNVPIPCKPRSIPELKKGEEKRITCTAETLLSEGTYLAPLAINLGYEYTTKLDKKLEVRSLNLVEI